MLYHVKMYDDGDTPVAEAHVEAESFEDARTIAFRIMRKDYPGIDPERYNQTMITDELYRGPTL